MMYGQQANNQILSFYYLILWKSYSKEENIWELILTVMQLQKLINIFHKDNLEKLSATSLPLGSALLMARLLILKELK